jgi:hypothetical protein
MPTAPTDAQPPARLLNVAEVAHALGVEVRHVRRLVHEKRIPYDAPMDCQVGDGPVCSCR